MATTEPSQTATAGLQELAKRHLWMHFTRMGAYGADQARELGFFTNWSYAHPRSIELAARVASLAPGDLNRVFFTSGDSEAVESALKLARAYHRLRGEG